MLDELPPTSSVSVTSPENLAKELFTHRGAGTLVRRGERVRAYTSFKDVDAGRLRALLETCFGRALHPEYFEKKQPLVIYLADSYRATAIVTLEHGVPYLDKFAVTTEAQGEGIGGSIWKRLLREHPKLFWRARAQNPVNGWYAENAGGLYKTEKWWVFWCGMTDFSEIRRSVEHALSMPATLEDPRPEPEIKEGS
jgi:acetylglutamate kinase